MTINSGLSSNGYLTYIGILMLLRKNENTYFVRSDSLSYLLTRTYPPIKQIMKCIDYGMVELAKKQMIVISQSDKAHEWIIDTDPMKIDNKKSPSDYYTRVDEKEIQKILTSNNQYYTRSISLINFYIYVLSTLFKKKGEYEGVGFTSLSDMSELYGINVKTILSYLNQLEELELLYVYRAKDSIQFEDGEIREISHTYGRYKDKQKIIQVGSKHEEEYGIKMKAKFKKIQKIRGDTTRAASHKYKHIIKCLEECKEIPYTYKECKEIYLLMADYNKRYSYKPERNKDLSVFKNFDFYNNE